MKKIMAMALAATLSTSAFAKDVCMVIVTGTNGYTTNGVRSCDGQTREDLGLQGMPLIEAVSGALSSLYQEQMRLINCQVNQTGVAGTLEYACVVAR